MKIDLFCHILPPKYVERMRAVSTRAADLDAERKQSYEGNARKLLKLGS